MGMVVRSNIMAVNAQRQLGMNNSSVGKALEKLSSGYRINRAGDDASGLAISEKMKAQIKGLDTASLNAQDGVSVVQTAEGALTEVHNMLNRMTELATRAANGINEDTNRQSLQNEIKELQTEIDRISQATNFNGINLLDGSLGGGTSGAAGVPSISGLQLTDTAATKYSGSTVDFVAVGTNAADNGKIGMTVNYTDAKGNSQSVKVEMTYSKAKKSLIAADGTEYKVTDTDGKATKTELQDAFLAELKKTGLDSTFKMTKATDAIKFEAKEAGATTKIDSILSDLTPDATTTTNTLQTLQTPTAGADAFQSIDFAGTDYTLGDVFTVGGQKFAFVGTQDEAVALGKGVNAVVIAGGAGGTIADNDVSDMANLIEQKTGYLPTANTTKLEFKSPAGVTAGAAGKGLVLQIGDTADGFNEITVSIDNMSSKGIGIDGVDISTREGAASAINTIRAGIDKVSAQRAVLGATQNRLEYTINNLDTTSENLQSANSRIRDTDMAKMMMEYTKMNVLTQSAQAMLAQANQQPQSVLQLLQ